MIIIALLASLFTIGTICFGFAAWFAYGSGEIVAGAILLVAFFVFLYPTFAFWYAAYRVYRDYGL